MIKILLIAISLSCGTVDYNEQGYEPMELAMTIPQDLYAGAYEVEFTMQHTEAVVFGNKKAWQSKDTSMTQKEVNIGVI